MMQPDEEDPVLKGSLPETAAGRKIQSKTGGETILNFI
jgi:hypothetical protein